MGRFAGISSTAVKPNVPPSSSTASTMQIEQITDRPGGDTRPLNPAHVEALAESILVVGLIQPIAVDSQGQLLAGGHRKAAIVHLKATDEAAYDKWFPHGVPVHRFDFDASQDEALALAIEATENEKRRDYTPAEVRELADRLRQAGYEDLKGRPKKGQKSVVLALSTIIGKSDDTVRRYLNSDTPQKGTQVRSFSEAAKPTARSLAKLIDREDCPEDVAKLATRLLKLIDE
jgi:ParB family transcriptional regulator, chromosome partitioning protein